MGAQDSDKEGSPPHAPSISWKDMFHSASSLGSGQAKDEGQTPELRPSFSSPALNYNSISEGPPKNSKIGKSSSIAEDDATAVAKVKFRQICKKSGFSTERLGGEESDQDDGNDDGLVESDPDIDGPPPPEEQPRVQSGLNEANFQLAIYIAMAHGGLVLVVLVLYGMGRLLKDFWKPIQWAVLCSMPLREVQQALLTFWTKPLQVGLVQSLVAAPLAGYKAILGTLLDAREGVLRFVGKGKSLGPPKPVGFAKLFQWLVSFGFFTLGLDILGPGNLSLVAFIGLLMYAAGSGFEVSQLTTALSQNGRLRRSDSMAHVNWAIGSIARACRAANQRISRSLIKRIHTLVAVGLITTMILGSLGGLALFSYKVGMEGKDAVVLIKVHLEKNDYAEVVGTELNKWVEENKVPELIDEYVVKGYDALMEQVDVFAANNNLTEFVDVGKDLVMGFIRGGQEGALNKTVSDKQNPLLLKLHDLQVKVRAFDFQGIMSDIEAAFLLFLEHFQLKKEDFLEKAKQVAQRSTDVGRRLLSSGSSMVQSGASAFIFVSRAIASGAAELFNFVTQSVIFFSVLYYLITSEKGGVMEQILEMVPLSEPTRKTSAMVLDHAVSSVLLATVKVAFFQASFTWLLFRFCDIHFLYGSTLMALVQAFLPLFPAWFVSVPLAVEFALERHYVGGILLMLLHMWVMDYGMEKIHDDIPGHNAYLTGLSIAGGMAFFTPALEGAIMGPLLMTVLIATKNLYAEFVLREEKAVD